jgi:hypothetical protein
VIGDASKSTENFDSDVNEFFPLFQMLWLVLFTILGIICRIAAEEAPCTIHNDGKYFDLNPLKSRYEAHIRGHNERTLTFAFPAKITNSRLQVAIPSLLMRAEVLSKKRLV